MKTWTQFLVEMGDPLGNNAHSNVQVSPDQIEKELQRPDLTDSQRRDLQFLLDQMRGSQQRAAQQPAQKQQPQSQAVPPGAPHIDQTPTIPPGQLRWR